MIAIQALGYLAHDYNMSGNPWSYDHICNLPGQFPTSKINGEVNMKDCKSVWWISSIFLPPAAHLNLQAACTNPPQPPLQSPALPYFVPGTPASSRLKTQTSGVITATWTAGIGISKWCSHVTWHFMIAWLKIGNPYPKYHYNPCTIYIIIQGLSVFLSFPNFFKMLNLDFSLFLLY